MAETYVDSNGYRRFSDSNRLVHRWVAEKQIGRPLREGEEVHHKNRFRSDNRPENLKVYRGRWGFLRHAVDHEDENY
ncbi:MAG: HNH endonuclease [Candidatus Woesearchaeota archaeon]|nr:HNH endonuclease [Candidatus Woesearchaeota archaeon]